MFTADDCRRFRNLEGEMNALLAKHGFQMKFEPRMTFQSTEIHAKMTVMPVAQNGVDPVKAAEDALKATFMKYATAYGLKETDYNRVFSMGGKFYKLVGVNPSRPKNAMRIKDTRTGKEFVAPTASVRRALGYDVPLDF